MPINCTVDGHIMVLEIQGESAHNPMTQDMYLELHDRFEEFEHRREYRVAVLAGAGDLHFSVGGHLKHVNKHADEMLSTEAVLSQHFYPHDQTAGRMIGGTRRLSQLQLTKPVIGAVRGYCLGAALIIVGQKTDIRIAGRSAKFGLTEIKRGLGGGAAVATRLREQIPWSWVMWMVATGESIDAETAFRIGLVNEVVDDERVVDRAMEVAAMVAEMPPLGVRAEKQALVETAGLPFERAVALVGSLSALTRMTDDVKEGIAAFAGKRPPEFKGL
jgi:(E)-benzylidenesuccinyl-CoA hydratase